MFLHVSTWSFICVVLRSKCSNTENKLAYVRTLGPFLILILGVRFRVKIRIRDDLSLGHGMERV